MPRQRQRDRSKSHSPVFSIIHNTNCVEFFQRHCIAAEQGAEAHQQSLQLKRAIQGKMPRRPAFTPHVDAAGSDRGGFAIRLFHAFAEPVGAIVEVTWKEGVKGGVTPFDLSVPKNASVRFTFSKKDFVSWTTDVIADTPKVVRASLLAEPKAAPPPRVLKGKSEGSDKKARQAASKEDDIPVEF